jgi:predicted DCC family thiol-disulfide oxidoreductase YuxK
MGWSWATSQSLRNQIAVDGLRKEFLAAGAPELVFAFAGWDALFLAMGVLTLVVELGAPAALLHRKLAGFWVAAASMMHWGIFFIMGIEFRYALIGLPFVAFFRLERLLPQPGEAVVLFDGKCAPCVTSRRWAARLDWFGAVKWKSFRDPEVRAAVPQLSDQQLESEMWVIVADGRMLPGFDGWRYLLSRFPVTRLPSLALYVPPIPSVGRRVYRRIADRRRACEFVPQRSVASGSHLTSEPPTVTRL